MCFALFFLNVIVFIFLSSIVVFMDYYITIVEGCLRVGMGVAGGGGVGVASFTKKKKIQHVASKSCYRETNLVGPLLGWGDCTQANYLARVSLTN